MRTLNLIGIAAFLVLLMSVPAFAQWQVNGVQLGTIPGGSPTLGQTSPAVAPDGSGGLFVAWTVWGSVDSTDVVVQHLNGDGYPLWISGGVLVCGAPHHQFTPWVVSDGSGGAIITWTDERSGNYIEDDVYAQRVDAAGTPQWTANGVPVTAASGAQYSQKIISDGAGGAIIAWTDERAGHDIYAQRLNAAGVAQFASNGQAVCTAVNDQFKPELVPDGAGGAIITWSDYRGADADVYAQRLSAVGAVQWTSDGVVVAAAAHDQSLPKITSIAAGGAIIAWSDRRALDSDIYAQRLNSAGVPQWVANGVAACTNAGDQFMLDISATDAAGADIVWMDRRSDLGDVYVQRITSSGAAAWTLNGVAVCNAAGVQGDDQIVSTPSATFVTWSDKRGADYDLYVQKLNIAGVPQWTANGVAIGTAPNHQVAPLMLPDTAGGVFLQWKDGRSGAYLPYAERVSSAGEPLAFVVTSPYDDYAPGSLRIAIAQANAIPGAQTISFNIPGAATIQLYLYNPLPAITDALTIDGFTQPGSSPNTNPMGAPSNAQIKIEITGPGFTGFFTAGLEFQATGTVRGVAISGYSNDIYVTAPDVVIEGNYLGTDASGLVWSPQASGSEVNIAADRCRVGGAVPASRNVICHADLAVWVQAADARIFGNYIGVGADGATPIPNSDGILLYNGASGAHVGSSVLATSLNAAEKNVIAHNNQFGVSMLGSATGNLVVGNSIFANLRNLDLADDGENPNDVGDVDSGPNGLQNHPDLSSAIGTHIAGTMMGAPNSSLTVHCYWSPNCCGDAVTYVGGTTVALGGSGSAPVAFDFTQPVPPASYISATATDALGNTSEIAQSVLYQNTSGGSNVAVNLVDASGILHGTATYGSVSGAGNTYFTNPFTPPVPVSANFSVGNPNDPSIYYDVTTNVSYGGGVDVCLFYDVNNLPGPEANLVLAHYNGSIWEDVTTARDLVNHEICGHVTTLSPFVIAVLTPTGIGSTPVPATFALHSNIPNPFNPQTTIHYDIPAGGADVNISIYDVAGRLVRELVNEHRAAGTWSVQWNGEDDRGQRVASGVYFYRMRAGSFVDTKKMVLLK